MRTNFFKHVTLNDFLAVVAFTVFIGAVIYRSSSVFVTGLSAVFLGVGISTAVHSAEVIAHRLGSAMGTLILALSVTIIEVALIVALMGNPSPEASTVARDTVFSAIMIVTNGILGVCILLGGMRHKELGFHSMGTSSLLAVLATLSALIFVLPNFTTSTVGPTYSEIQLVFVSAASLVLYGALVWAQTKSHKNFFEPVVANQEANSVASKEQVNGNSKVEEPSKARALLSFAMLLLSLITVVGMAKLLSPSIEAGVAAIGAPRIVVGIVIALLVLAPETLAAVKAAKVNQLQTSLNLALGSGAASIALTIPVVSLYSILTDKSLSLGLDPKSTAFLVITFLAGSLTLGSGRATALHGVVHLTIMSAYIALSFMP